MGQRSACCIEKDVKENKQYNPKSTNVIKHQSVTKLEAQQNLSSSAARKYKSLLRYQITYISQIPKGQFIDSYKYSSNPQGYYYGQWNKELFHGRGIFFFRNGSLYEGTFVNGIAEGEGRYIFNNGCIYEGQLKNNEASGQGCYYDQHQGYEYAGQWKNDVPQGIGKQKFANNSYYEGEFRKGEKQGQGRYVSQAGIYQGNFQNGCFNGEGTFKYVDNRKYSGNWKDGFIDGYGTFIWPDGNRYEGQYKSGLKHGNGIFYFFSGKIFRGGWSYGKKNGFGQLLVGDQTIKGRWEDGQLKQTISDQ